MRTGLSFHYCITADVVTSKCKARMHGGLSVSATLAVKVCLGSNVVQVRARVRVCAPRAIQDFQKGEGRGEEGPDGALPCCRARSQGKAKMEKRDSGARG